MYRGDNLKSFINNCMYKIWALVVYYAVYSGNSLPAFRDNLPVPFLRDKKSKKELLPYAAWCLWRTQISSALRRKPGNCRCDCRIPQSCGTVRNRYTDRKYATGWTVRGSNTGCGKSYFSSPNRPYRLSGPPNLLFSSYREVKRPERDVNHAPPSSAEVRNEWRYNLFLLYTCATWAGASVPCTILCFLFHNI